MLISLFCSLGFIISLQLNCLLIFWFCNCLQTEGKLEEGPGWTILRDDFMMGASMKDWDKESDGADNSRPGSGSDSDT